MKEQGPLVLLAEGGGNEKGDGYQALCRELEHQARGLDVALEGVHQRV